MWLEREAASLQELLDRKALKNRSMGGHWNTPFLTETERARDVRESTTTRLKRNAGMDASGMDSSQHAHGEVSAGGRARIEQVPGEQPQRDRAQLYGESACHDRASMWHGDLSHHDPATMFHGDLSHHDRASMFHGDLSHHDRASMLHGDQSHQDRASTWHGNHRLLGWASMPHDENSLHDRAEVKHGDECLRGRAHMSAEHGDVYQQARALSARGRVCQDTRADDAAFDGGRIGRPVGAEENHGGGSHQRARSRPDREMVEDGDLKAIPIQFPTLPAPEGRDASLEAGDWIIQLGPLVGDLSKDATAMKCDSWLHADPLSRLRIAARNTVSWV